MRVHKWNCNMYGCRATALTCELVLLALHGLDGALHLVLALGARLRQLGLLLLNLRSREACLSAQPCTLVWMPTENHSASVNLVRGSKGKRGVLALRAQGSA